MRKTVEISRIVSEIHINETRWLSPSVETHSLHPMLIPIPRLRRQAQREESPTTTARVSFCRGDTLQQTSPEYFKHISPNA